MKAHYNKYDLDRYFLLVFRTGDKKWAFQGYFYALWFSTKVNPNKGTPNYFVIWP